MLFVDIQLLGSVAAVCKLFRACTFDDVYFWQAYLSPSCQLSISGVCATQMRSLARRSVFGLEGPWGRKFAELVWTQPHADTFARALRVLSGLAPEDDQFETARFFGALVQLVGTFDACCPDSRRAAEEAVTKAQDRETFFPAASTPFPRAATPVQRLTAFLQTSIQRAEDACSIQETKVEQICLEQAQTESTRTMDSMPNSAGVGVASQTFPYKTALRSSGMIRGIFTVVLLAVFAFLSTQMSEMISVDEGFQEVAILAVVMPVGLAVGAFSVAQSQRQRACKAE
jgi:hypothetical protein